MQKLILIVISVLFSATNLFADSNIDVQMLRSLALSAEPAQIVATADGQRIYVLTKQGEIQLFSSNGDPLGTFDAGPDVASIAPQGKNRLILDMGKQKKMLLVALEPIVQISTEGSPFTGPADAPITIAVYDDFECPYCAKAVPLLKQVVNAYPDKVKLVFKNFPLGMHKNARAAAVAGLAADKQGKFWPYHDLLFANYNKLSPNKIIELAQQAGLDMVKFNTDRKDPRLTQKLNADLQEGKQIGVRGTPSIFINGRRLPQRNKAAFDQLIKEELAKLAKIKQ